MSNNHQNVNNKPLQHVIKRLFDIVFSLMILVLLSPLFLLLAIWIVIDDGLPVFYRQKRVGYQQQPFYIYKFRSMKNKQVAVKSNSHDTYHWLDGVPDDFVFKIWSEDNVNVTNVGKFIRKYSLDELPQFLNVLKGDMSIIGPRPEIPAIAKHYNAYQQGRLQVVPGITGWAQVNGRSDMNHGDKIRHDLYYVRYFSLGLDMKIFFRTVIQVFTGKGSV